MKQAALGRTEPDTTGTERPKAAGHDRPSNGFLTSAYGIRGHSDLQLGHDRIVQFGQFETGHPCPVSVIQYSRRFGLKKIIGVCGSLGGCRS